MTMVTDPDRAAELIESGMTIGIGGLQGNHPMALLRAIARSGATDLRLAGPPVGMAPEFLIATGAVKSLAAPYMGSEGVVGVAPAYRHLVETAALELWECDEAILLTALRAAAQDLPYLPWRGGAGTDLTRLNPDLQEYTDEPSGTRLVRVPALRPDVAILRALEADEFGNVRYHEHSAFADPALARAAGMVIVEVERLAGHRSFLHRPDLTVHHRVDAIVLAPLGSHPFRAAGVIDQDDRWLRDWVTGIKAAIAEGVPIRDSVPVKNLLKAGSEGAYIDSVGVDRLNELTASYRPQT